MPKLSAGNSGMASKVDASGSSSTMDIHLWFRGTATDAERGIKVRTPGFLKVAGLAPETTDAALRGLLQRYYSTVSEVRVASDANGRCKGYAQVKFDLKGERDRGTPTGLARPKHTTFCRSPAHSHPNAADLTGIEARHDSAHRAAGHLAPRLSPQPH